MWINQKRGLTTTQIIAFGFLGAIVVGTLLLMLPISSAEGVVTKWEDALFTATTSVCVTGLVTVPTWSQWSVFGQSVIMLLIQVGGLGIVTFTTIVLFIMGKRISLKERLLIQNAYNLDTLRGLVRLTLRIVKGTFFIEGVGALLCMIVMVPQYGLVRGIGISIFHSVSAFCNAGMDVIGNSSLMGYYGNVLVNITTASLIVLGGIGFPVWWNVIDVLRRRHSDYNGWRDAAHHLTLHTKVVLSVTVLLIFAGMLVVLLFEYDNPDTLGAMAFGDKVLVALFQSVTTRTAGFFTIPQDGLRNATALFCTILMFVGGSPSGTAGGIKTTTLGIIFLTICSIVKGKKDTEAFGRRISAILVKRAMAVIALSFWVMLLSVMALSMVEKGDFMDILYEGASAIATVGLSRGLTTDLTIWGKLIMIITMYIGRIGPISLALFFNSKKYIHVKRYPEEKMGVG